ncbi:hypothetical protein Ddye_028836 [Dipteronia dyeriana]|uniref:Kin17 KOW domain-containing protein n=1 Tax=Dipteronia dyeriana TaxID=168575 RepID=A0AAD9TDA8_9ROSI|nr:hypothetical protein Ddye_028836 [Dipteronia dyeriana]
MRRRYRRPTEIGFYLTSHYLEWVTRSKLVFEELDNDSTKKIDKTNKASGKVYLGGVDERGREGQRENEQERLLVVEIEMLDNKHVLRVDQDELEIVIPQIGGLVKIVNGAYRNSNARLMGVDTDKFCAKVKIEKGVYDGRVLNAIDYEDICKLA